MNILISSPSLNENENVSGISSLVKCIISSKSEHVFYHLRLGKTDNQKKTNITWFVNQIMLIPTVFFKLLSNKIDLVHLNTGLEKASVIRDYIVFFIAKKVFGKKILFHIHGGYFLMQPPPKSSAFFKMINSIAKNADIVIVLSELEKKTVDATYHVSSNVLVNAINVPSDIKEDYKAFDKPFKLIFLGRIVKSKGILVIIDSLKKLGEYCNDFHLDIYGAGPETNLFLSGLSAIPGLSYAYHGIIAGDNKWKALKKAHVFLLPSIHSEGLPVAMLEAMGAGCIAVVSDDASISTVVTDGENGYIVKRGDSEGLFERLKFIFNNPAQLTNISNTAINIVANKHNMNCITF
jgi:glycosyltransferase involved in cell wall biosynthesis